MKENILRASSSRRWASRLSLLWMILVCFGPAVPGMSMELEPYPTDSFSRDDLTISFFREERPSFYWVNAGVPDVFFNGVSQVSSPPNGNLIYSIHSIEYGVTAEYWLTDHLQLRATLPLEGNALLDANGNTQNVTKFGDVEVAGTYLLLGNRKKGAFVGIDGSYRFATGTNPFELAYPLLSTGKGAAEEALGILLGEDAGRFSFFQSIDYQKTQPIILDSTNNLFGAGTFQWPDNVDASGRIEFHAFHRAQRLVDLYYELRMRMSGQMEFNQQVVSYGQGLTTDLLLFSTLGMAVRVDNSFTADGKLSFFPFDPIEGRPDLGWLFSLALKFRPI